VDPCQGDGDRRQHSSLLSRLPPGALVLSSIASGQVGSALAEKMFHRVGPGGAVLLRLLWATIFLVAIRRPRVRGRSGVERLLVLAFGVALAGMNLAFYIAIDHIDLGAAVTIEFIGPLAVAVAGSRRRLDLLWVALAGAGILLLTRGSPHHLDALGVGFALLAGLFWAAYILLSVRVGRTFEDGAGLALGMCVACVCTAPPGLIEGGSGLLDPVPLGLGATVGLLSSAIPYAFELEALRHISTPVFGVAMSLEPAFAVLVGLVVLGQGLGPRAGFGVALVVGASMGALRHGSIHT
jgi:inner membrane transporter RhtA